MASNLTGLLGGGLSGFGLGVQQQQASYEAMQNQYSINAAYGMSAATYTPDGGGGRYCRDIRIDGTYYDYARDRPLTNAEWLDRRIEEMRVRL